MPDISKRDEHHRIYDAIWKNMDRENQLINHRIIWAIVLSGGIFAGSAVLVTAIVHSNNALQRGLLFLLMALIASTGIFFSIRTREGVRAAHSQLDYLKEKYQALSHKFEIEYGWPLTFGDRHDHLRGNNAAMAFPELMYWNWLIVAIIEQSLASIFLYIGLKPILNI